MQVERTNRSFDAIDPDTYVNGHPYAAYARLRKENPVLWHPEEPPGRGFWLLTRYDDVRHVSRHPEIFSSSQGFKAQDDSYERMGPDIDAAMRQIILAIDPPDHTAMRALLMPFFTTGALKGMEDGIRERVKRILAPLKAGDTIDVVPDLAAELPIQVLCEVLGVDKKDHEQVLAWTYQMTGADDPDFNITPARAAGAFREVFEFGRRSIDQRRQRPTGDLVSAVANARFRGELLDRDQVDGFFALMIGAGNETTRNAISGSIHALARFPEQKRILAQDPSVWPTAIEELLRYLSPVIHMRRTTLAGTEISGKAVASGDKIVMLYGAANRDPEVFETPDDLDVRRGNARRHFAFGTGIHQCLGAMLARMELRIVLQEFLTKFPDYRPQTEPTYLRSNFVHGIKSYSVTLH
ncbi:MAG: cytochrome P450 [Gammaproteobacteria bacterium]|nr:cytochrome P450 [Rhodospirillaceae bacterium]MYJ75002.1 cytochrome P450 [Gammaproteobacteria bacterium]